MHLMVLTLCVFMTAVSAHNLKVADSNLAPETIFACSDPVRPVGPFALDGKCRDSKEFIPHVALYLTYNDVSTMSPTIFLMTSTASVHLSTPAILQRFAKAFLDKRSAEVCHGGSVRIAKITVSGLHINFLFRKPAALQHI